MQRSDFAITNLYKFYTLDDEPPTDEQFAAHWPIFCREIAIVKPSVLVTFGDQVSEFIFKKCGLEYRGQECHHGLPFKATLPLFDGISADVDNEPPEDDAGIEYLLRLLSMAPEDCGPLDLIVFPCIHPAAGIHQVSNMQNIHQDFMNLSKVLSGKLKPRDANSANPQCP